MNNELNLDARTLGKGRIRRLHETRPYDHRVECLSGALWITQDGDSRDIILAPGDSFSFDRIGDALISALEDSRFLLLEACPAQDGHPELFRL
jgi:hypothetical protein